MQSNHSAPDTSAPNPLLDMLRFVYRDRLALLESQRQEAWGEGDPHASWSLKVLTRPAAALLQAPAPRLAPHDGDELMLTPRKGTAQRRVAAAIDRLMARYSDLPDVVQARMGTMKLCFLGAPAEEPVYAIPDFQGHFQAVNAQWPYWLHFLAPTKENMTLLMLMLSSKKEMSSNMVATMPIDELFQQIKRLVLASVNLQQISGVPTECCREHSRSVLNALAASLKPSGRRPATS